MKLKFYSYLILLLASLVIISCESEEDPAPQAAATFTANKTTAKVGEDIQFSNTSENATAFKWSFGDGTTSKEVAPKKSYLASGTYLVSLVSTGEGGSSISDMQITIVPDALFTVAGSDDLIALTPVQFTNASVGATSYEWSFGNPANSTSTETNPTFTYLTPGTFTVTLTAISPEGESTYSQDVVVKAATPDVYFAEYGNSYIKKLALDGSGTVSNFLDVAGMAGAGLAYDEVHGKIYFSDFEVDGEGKIWRVNLDGTGAEAIVTGLFSPYAVALDVENGKVYWGDDWDGDDVSNIGRANLDGSAKENIVTMTGAELIAIAIDTKHDKLYFYDIWNEDLYIANLDGTNPDPILSGVYGYAIQVDTEHDKIYFDEQNAEELQRANLDGSNVETVDTNGSRIYGIAIDTDNDKIIWSGRDSGSISSANLDGTGKVALKTGLSSPRGLFLRK